MKSFKLHEDVPTMSAGSGQIAGIGVGPDGEPGVDMRARKKKRTQDQQKAELHVPKELVPSGLTEEQTPLDVELWAAAQEMAKDEYPDHPTPESTKFAVDWYVKHGGEYASNTVKTDTVDVSEEIAPAPCWDGYEMVGMKMKDGKEVPNCVPKNEENLSTKVDEAKKSPYTSKVMGSAGQMEYRGRTKSGKSISVRSNAWGNWYGYEGTTKVHSFLGWDNNEDDAIKWLETRLAENTSADREWGTDSLTKIYKMDTPGELEEAAKPSIHQIETGDRVKGRYMNQFPFTGKVYDQRPHSINHKIQIFYVKLDKPITVFGARRDSIVINASDDQYAAIRFSGGSGGDSIEKLKEAVALTELLSLSDAWEKITTCQQCKKKLSPRELKLGARVCDACIKKNKGKIWGKDSDDVYDEDVRWTDAYTTEDCGCDEPVKEALSVPKKPISRVVVDYMHGKAGGSMAQTRSVLAVSNLARPQARSESAVLAYLRKRHPKEEVILLNVDFLDSSGKPIGESVQPLEEAEYQGRKVTLNDPFRSSDGKHKFYVYVQNDKGNVIKLGFGDPNMEIKRDDPDRRKAYRDRHNCSDPGPKWKANYWSCRMWSDTSVSKMTEAGFPINERYRILIDFSVQDERGSWSSKRTPYTIDAKSAKAALDKALAYAMKLYRYDDIDQRLHPSLEVKIMKEMREATNTNTATRVNQKLPKFTLATAAKYKLDPPYKNPHDHRNRSYQYVILSTTHVPHTGWETYVFPADATGTAPVSWTELPASTRGTTEPRNTLTDINNPLSHVAVLKDMGYTLR